MEDGNIKQWLDNLRERRNMSQRRMHKDQVLMALLNKITELMKAGRFKEAGILRTEFDTLKGSEKE